MISEAALLGERAGPAPGFGLLEEVKVPKLVPSTTKLGLLNDNKMVEKSEPQLRPQVKLRCNLITTRLALVNFLSLKHSYFLTSASLAARGWFCNINTRLVVEQNQNNHLQSGVPSTHMC